MKLRLSASPAAHLTIADARWAVLATRFARRHDGAVLLCLEDADRPADGLRASPVESDLRWLGIAWETLVRQSDRPARYAAAAETLRRSGRLYACFESGAELAAKRDRRVRRGQPATYDRAMLHLAPAQRAAAEAGGKRPYWRFRLSNGACRWRDLVLGPQAIPLEGLSDPVLVRADGLPLRLFAAVVDDIDLGITHALRDAEHLAGTAMELDIRAALGADPAGLRLAHIPPLACDRPVPSVRRLRADGIEAAALAGYLAGGDADRLAAAPARIDIAALRRANRDALARMPFEAVAARLPAGATAAFWEAIRGGIDLLAEAGLWWDVVSGDVTPAAADPSLLRAALTAMPASPWSVATWTDWLAAIPSSIGHGDPASALRRALTGEDDGPAMSTLLPLIGAARAAERLRRGAAA